MTKKRHDKSTRRQPDYLLFFGNLDHQNEFASYSKSRLHPFPNIDQISFRKPVKIHLIRIVRPKGNLYQQFASINNITQQQPIKRLQVFYKNLERRSSDYARYGVIARNSQVRENNPDKDVMYGVQKGVENYDKVITDLLILKGFFTKLTVCVYGCILQEDSRQCYFYGKNIPLQIFKHNKSSVSQFANQRIQPPIRPGLLKLLEKTNFHLPYLEHTSEPDPDNFRIQELNQKAKQLHQLLLNLQSCPSQTSMVSFRSQFEQLQNEFRKLFEEHNLNISLAGSLRPNSLSIHINQLTCFLAHQCLIMSPSEQIRALSFTKIIANSQQHAKLFVHLGGMEAIYQILRQSVRKKIGNFDLLNSECVDVINLCTNWEFGIMRFIDIELVKPLKQKKLKPRDIETESKAESETKKRSRSRSRKKEKKKKRNQSQQSQKKSKRYKEKKKKQRKENKKFKKQRKYKHSQSQQKPQPNQKKKREKLKDKSNLKKQDYQKKSEINQNDNENQKITGYHFMVAWSTQLYSIKVAKNLYHLLEKSLNYYLYRRALESIKKIQKLFQYNLNQQQKVSQFVQLYNIVIKGYQRFYQSPPKLLIKDWDTMQKALLKTNHYTRAWCNIFKHFPLLDLFFKKDVMHYPLELLMPYSQLIHNMPIMPLKYLHSIYCKIESEQLDDQLCWLLDALIKQIRNKYELLDQIMPLRELFEVNTSEDLRKKQAVIALVLKLIYKCLIQDDGYKTFPLIENLYRYIVEMRKVIVNDTWQYSKELKKNICLISNYFIVFQAYFKDQGFKYVTQIFLERIKYQKLDLNLLSKKKQDVTFESIREDFRLGNFYTILPQQPLVQLYACLKIFCILARGTRNSFVFFTENGITPAFVELMSKITNLLKWLLQDNVQSHYSTLHINKGAIIRDYVFFLERLLTLIQYKTCYEASYCTEDICPQACGQREEVPILISLYIQVCKMIRNEENLKIYLCQKKLMSLYQKVVKAIGNMAMVEWKNQKFTPFWGIMKQLLKIHLQFSQYRQFLYLLHIQLSWQQPYIYLLMECCKQQDIQLYSKQETILQCLLKNELYSSDGFKKKCYLQFVKTVLNLRDYEISLRIVKFIEGQLRNLTKAIIYYFDVLQLLLQLILQLSNSQSFSSLSISTRLDQKLLKLYISQPLSENERVQLKIMLMKIFTNFMNVKISINTRKQKWEIYQGVDFCTEIIQKEILKLAINNIENHSSNQQLIISSIQLLKIFCLNPLSQSFLVNNLPKSIIHEITNEINDALIIFLYKYIQDPITQKFIYTESRKREVKTFSEKFQIRNNTRLSMLYEKIVQFVQSEKLQYKAGNFKLMERPSKLVKFFDEDVKPTIKKKKFYQMVFESVGNICQRALFQPYKQKHYKKRFKLLTFEKWFCNDIDAEDFRDRLGNKVEDEIMNKCKEIILNHYPVKKKFIKYPRIGNKIQQNKIIQLSYLKYFPEQESQKALIEPIYDQLSIPIKNQKKKQPSQIFNNGQKQPHQLLTTNQNYRHPLFNPITSQTYSNPPNYSNIQYPTYIQYQMNQPMNPNMNMPTNPNHPYIHQMMSMHPISQPGMGVNQPIINQQQQHQYGILTEQKKAKFLLFLELVEKYKNQKDPRQKRRIDQMLKQESWLMQQLKRRSSMQK